MPISKVKLPNNTTQDVHDSRVVSDEIVYIGDTIDSATYTADGIVVDLSDYQEKLVSGTNIKTVNNQSLLGSGNLTIEGEENVIERVSFNGTNASISNKTAAITATLDNVNDGSTRKLSNYVTLNTAQTINGTKSFAATKWSLSSNENNEITNNHWNNSTYYKTDDSEVLFNLAAIRNAIRFKWYDDYFDIGVLRSGSSTAYGFAIGKENSAGTHVLDYFRVTGTGAYVLGNKIATESQLTNGSVTKIGSSTVGSTSMPIYLNNGTPTQVSEIDGKYVSGSIGYWKRGFIVTHPESSYGIIIPYLYNDIAFLAAQGGSVSVYSTTATDLTTDTLTVKTDWNTTAGGDKNKMFDASPSYYSPGNAYATEMNADGLIIDITLPRTFTYSNQFYIDYGNGSWGFQHIDILVKNTATETSYVSKVTAGEANNSCQYFCRLEHSSKDANNNTVSGFNRIRLHLYDRTNTGGVRIAQIGLVNYGSIGHRYTMMSRGFDDEVWRSITPAITGTYYLGTSSKRWFGVFSNVLDTSGNASIGGTASITGNIYGGNELQLIPESKAKLRLICSNTEDSYIQAGKNGSNDGILRLTGYNNTWGSYLYAKFDNFYSLGNFLVGTSDANKNLTVYGNIIKSGGTSSQFLKADGSVDSNTYVTSETDPVFTASAAHGISSTDISNWNAKQKAITVSSSEPTSSQGSNGDIWIVI